MSKVISFAVLLATISLSGCSTFTTEQMMSVHSGMSSDEILTMFGKPDSVRSGVCGGATGNPWNCTTWKYENLIDSATFMFSGEHGELRLNNFDFNKY
ncbi:hypothetical protein BBM38_15620 [Vibrio parahaemolyticus]|uniref:hypothetical protein n=1 Tax=Vibrio parahaemolyticus TaxID=670 RepID=UPI00086E46DF|nr:hypothetical protein [Vibrio parahaemolyticus]ODZ33069.1 hypothetical protein BBM38_15620 [Vibrio parahaemolyticus]